ncbi:MAG: winged helix-turn-helix domain-containing protein [Defluviitaleaceae bacterium]|nr:winged helix-turn-helix domain-containing protein [Defluviitaleaceae bacterium]
MKYEENNDDFINCGDIILCVNSRTTHCNKTEIILTRNEFNVFHYLLKNQGKAISREELLNKIWGYDSEIETRATDDTVKRLRRKLAKVNSKMSIETVWGYGFIVKIDKKDKLIGLSENYKFDSITANAVEKKLNNYIEKKAEANKHMLETLMLLREYEKDCNQILQELAYLYSL